MEPGDPESVEMLRQAREKGEKLLAGLLENQAEVEANPPKHLTPEKLAEGKYALEQAIASTRRMLAALNDAQQMAGDSQQLVRTPAD
jgi:hypothetical protein